jgi:hypothetical protein
MDITAMSSFVVKRTVSTLDGSNTFTFYDENETFVLDSIKIRPAQVKAFFSALNQISTDLQNSFDPTPLNKHVVHDINGKSSTVEFV